MNRKKDPPPEVSERKDREQKIFHEQKITIIQQNNFTYSLIVAGTLLQDSSYSTGTSHTYSVIALFPERLLILNDRLCEIQIN